MSRQVQTSTAPSPGFNFAGGILFMLKTVLVSYLLSVALLFGIALFATFSPVSDGVLAVSVNTVTALGVCFCGFMSGRRFNSKGLIFGALCGLMYSVLLWILGMIFSLSFGFKSSALIAVAIGIVCGAVGGIVGINTKKQRSH